MDKCCGILMMQSSHPSFIHQYKNMIKVTAITESIFHSQSCSFHSLTNNHTLVLTSGYLLAKFAQDINTFDINQIQKYVKFALLKEQNKLIELNPLCLTFDSSFLEYLNDYDIDQHIGYVLFLEFFNSNDTHIIPQYIKDPLKQGQELITISSPFALQGQEMYKNYYKKAIISQIFSNDNLQQQIIILDLISQIGQEGGAVFNSNGEFVGMILQNIQIGQIYNRYFTFCMNWKVIESIIQQNLNTSKKQELINQSILINQMIQASTFISSNFGQMSSALIINDAKDKISYLLTNQCYMQSYEKNLYVSAGLNQTKAYILDNCQNKLNFTLFKCKDYQQGGLIIDEFINYKMLEVSQIVYMVCYQEGVFQNKPCVSKGRILKLILNDQNLNVSIITDCYIKNSLNGGGLFTEEGKLVGIASHSAKYLSEGVQCELSFITPILLLDSLFQDLYLQKQITQFSRKQIQEISKLPSFLQYKHGYLSPKF